MTLLMLTGDWLFVRVVVLLQSRRIVSPIGSKFKRVPLAFKVCGK